MQALNDWIKEIKNDPNISTFNEAQAKRSVIERILEFLGWDMYNYNEVILEYGVETRKVDYALQVNGGNKLFIEAKNPGEDLEKHQKQLLDYSFGEGVALAILTNGIAWWFYLPLKEGAWNDRKFYTIDILEQEIEDIIDKFDHLLSRENVASGAAIQHAESILESRQREERVKQTLPKAWNTVIKNAVSPDSLLVDLLAETVEEMDDFRPTNDEILGFIRSHQEKWLLSSATEQEVSQPATPSIPTAKPRAKKQTKKPKQMRIGSESYELRYGYEILVNTANWLIEEGNLKVSDRIKLSTQGSKNSRLNLFDDKIQNNRPQDWTELKNGLYIYKNLRIEDSIENAKKLLEHYKYDPEILKIEY